MSCYAKFNTIEAIKKRLKEGRGKGEGSTYRRWLNARDVPSGGRRHRIHCEKLKRTVHLLSDLERNCFYAGEYSPEVIDIREQFPLLPLRETQDIAMELGFRHPRNSGQDIVMTTDQVWTIQASHGTALRPIFVKYLCEHTKRRVIEKRTIEAAYWARRGADLVGFDEESVSDNFVLNWALVRPKLRAESQASLPVGLVRSVERELFSAFKEGSTPLVRMARQLTRISTADQAQVLSAIHYLIASRAWLVDLDAEPLSAT